MKTENSELRVGSSKHIESCTMLKYLTSTSLIFLAGCVSSTQIQTVPEEASIIFQSHSGETVDAFEGSFIVPENRGELDSRKLALKYVRFPSTAKSPGNPIIYLAGGPGGSGIETAKYNRFPLFMAMREFGDVIAFDQRGTGASNDLPNCTSSHHISSTQPTKDSEYFEIQRSAFAECLTFWDEQGFDIRGYTTIESASDLEDLRQHLGADKINLWGISYGSHLSLAALKQMDKNIERVVITAIEGLDQTIKLPARGDQYFDRLQAAINTVPEAKAKYPDIKGLIESVLTKLEAEPILLDVPVDNGESIPFLFQKRDLQQFTAALVMDPTRVVWILDVYRALDAGDTAPLISLLQRGVNPEETAVSFRPMTFLMDVASGTSSERQAMIDKQAKTALLGLHMNATMHLESIDPTLDLGDEFREPPKSDVPTLVLSGTLDGRTYPESGLEATVGLTNRQIVTVTNGGHNLFMLSPEITETIQNFMRGEIVDGRNIVVDLPEF